MDFTKNREFFFTVTVLELEFSNSTARLLQARIFHSWRETNHVAKDQ